MTDTMAAIDHPAGGGGQPLPRKQSPGSWLLVGAAALLTGGLAGGAALESSRDTPPPAGGQPGAVAGDGAPAVPEDTADEPNPPVVAGAAPEGYPFSDESFWRDSLRDAPVHEGSDGIVAHLAESVDERYGGVATLNLRQYNVAYYAVEPGTPTVDVQFDDCQDKGSTPSGLFDGDAHFADVPVPEDAQPADGDDGALVVYSPETDQLWEFWRASRTDDGWQACWGGRIDEVSTSPGYFGGSFGTTATGLSHAGGMISLADVRKGRIDHTVALLAAEPADFRTYSWPAQRSDGYSDDPDAVPEGLRLRLSAEVDVEALDLHPVAEMVARAAQEYGFVVVDKAGATGVYTESGAPEESRTGVDPWDEFTGDTPAHKVMAGFPWDDLEAMPMDYGKP